MVPERVDAISRVLVSPNSRRAIARLLAASVLGGIGLAGAEPIAAKGRKKKCRGGTSRCKVSKKKSICANLATDPANCGECGKACPGPTNGSGDATCSASACGISCTGATPDQCGTDCVDFQSDPNHCKDCGTACKANACQTPTCANGVCGTTPNGCQNYNVEQCYWLDCANAPCCWIPASSAGIIANDQATCQQYDCCNGGGCQAGGGACYKWSTSSCD